MNTYQKHTLFLLRLALGWYFVYAGASKIMNPAWTAAGYLKGAKTFPEFYNIFLNPSIIDVVNFLNEWGLLLVGLSLIVGLGMRAASLGGIMLMLLYYFPALKFPYAGTTALVVDDHIIFICIFIMLFSLASTQEYAVSTLLRKSYGKKAWFKWLE